MRDRQLGAKIGRASARPAVWAGALLIGSAVPLTGQVVGGRLLDAATGDPVAEAMVALLAGSILRPVARAAGVALVPGESLLRAGGGGTRHAPAPLPLGAGDDRRRHRGRVRAQPLGGAGRKVEFRHLTPGQAAEQQGGEIVLARTRGDSWYVREWWMRTPIFKSRPTNFGGPSGLRLPRWRKELTGYRFRGGAAVERPRPPPRPPPSGAHALPIAAP